MNPKSWKTQSFFFLLAEVWRAGSRTRPFRTVCCSVFWRRASRPIKNKIFFPNKGSPSSKPEPQLSYVIRMITPLTPSVRVDSVVGTTPFSKEFDRWDQGNLAHPVELPLTQGNVVESFKEGGGAGYRSHVQLKAGSSKVAKILPVVQVIVMNFRTTAESLCCWRPVLHHAAWTSWEISSGVSEVMSERTEATKHT